MGMYTELDIAVVFNAETPVGVIDLISYMARPAKEGDTTKAPPLLDHPLFGTDRWNWMLRSGGSYYFSGKPSLTWVKDTINHFWYLTLRTNIKNYTSEWEHFLSFIAPHVEEGWIGTYRYEEEPAPTLVWIKNKTVHMQTVKVPKEIQET